MIDIQISPLDLPRELGKRIQERRLDRAWTRSDLSARAQVSAETLKKFERTGQISLARLVRLSVALGVVGELEGVFTARLPASLQELQDGRRQRGRRRGTTRRAAQ